MAKFEEAIRKISKPTIKKGFSTIIISEKEVIVREGFWSGNSITFSTNENISLPKLMRFLDGKKALSEIFSKLNKVELKEFQELVNGLYKNNLLVDTNKKTNNKVAIISDNKNSKLSALIKVNLDGSVQFSNNINAADLVVICSEGINIKKLEEFNKKFIELKKPFIFVFVDGKFGIVGPTVVPKRTACFKCFELRLQSNMSAHNTYLKIREHELQVNTSLHKLNFLASMAVQDILKFFDEASATFNHAIFIDFENFDIELNPVYKLPRCADCGSSTPPDNPFINLPDILKES